MEIKTRFCGYCNKDLKGRSDKRFCDIQCKSAYHNSNTNPNEALIKDINKQLRRNRGALRQACPMGKATVPKEFLKKLGMDFRYLTHTWKSKNGNLYFFCYDYGYMPVEDQKKVLIIQQQDYMNK
jgi:hypothetical protein